MNFVVHTTLPRALDLDPAWVTGEVNEFMVRLFETECKGCSFMLEK